jgi:predicted DNA-binding protein with PD1-like motif
MEAKKIGGDGEQIYALVFETGDEVVDGLIEFSRSHLIRAAHFQGIGALSDVVLGYFDYAEKRYRQIPIEEQVEVVSLIGDIALEDDQPTVHAHLVVAHTDGRTHGGHLLAAHVRPTLEVVFSQSPRHLRRRVDPETGLALIDVEA